MINLSTKFEVSNFTCDGHKKGVAKCRKWGGLGSPKVTENSAIRQSACEFLFAFHSKCPYLAPFLLWSWPFDLISMYRVQLHTWVTQFWWKHLQVRRYCIRQVFRVIASYNLDLWPLIPKDNQHIYKLKYICDQNLVKCLSFGWEIRCLQGFRLIACCDLDIWPIDLISTPQALIHTSRNFGEINSNNYERIVCTLFSGSLPVVTLTFDPRS